MFLRRLSMVYFTLVLLRRRRRVATGLRFTPTLFTIRLMLRDAIDGYTTIRRRLFCLCV